VDGYAQKLTTGDLTATFQGISSGSAYTVEVTAAGMTQPARAGITANPIYVENIQVTDTNLKYLTVTWDFSGNAPAVTHNIGYIPQCYYHADTTGWTSYVKYLCGGSNWSMTEHSYQGGSCIYCEKFDPGYTGFAKQDGVWYYVRSGNVATDVNGLMKFNGEWWYLKKGRVASEVTTLVNFNGGWYYIYKGKVAANTTTLVKYNGAWWYVVKGKVAFGTNGLVKYGGEWWYLENGKVAPMTTLIKYNNEWWYVVNGKIASNTTTLVKYNGGWYYVKNGSVDWSYTGNFTYSGSVYKVNKGRVV
jgi:glucan-binding YG repeat protein